MTGQLNQVLRYVKWINANIPTRAQEGEISVLWLLKEVVGRSGGVHACVCVRVRGGRRECTLTGAGTAKRLVSLKEEVWRISRPGRVRLEAAESLAALGPQTGPRGTIQG